MTVTDSTAQRDPDTAELEWVFGYGSLMWNPGFPFIEQQQAMLHGYHRSFCIFSHHYRGTPEQPGLVLGLDEGGHCQGVAFRVARPDWAKAVDYLNERELIGYAYRPVSIAVELEKTRQTVQAYSFVADPTHPTYAGDLGLDVSAETIMHAAGEGGLNRDYLINSVKQLETRGYRDAPLHQLLERIELLTGLIDQGGGI
ncbi:MAG: gamma-glutamylcyclotransferase [Rhodospirillales bacterium]|nr:gamma-glutamylcyclotransferase [Rhodospirillales bacterium]